MTEQEIKQLLNELADYRAGRDAVALKKQELIDTILTVEVKAKLAEIDAEFADKLETVNEKAAEAEAKVKKAIIEHGETVKSTYLMGVWTNGRPSYDVKSLDGYAAGHPEILAFRKQGEPYVTIRGI